MKEENFKRAKEIESELKDLRYFSKHINSRWDETNMIVKKKADISYSILGSRFFGCGTHEQEIKVPKSAIVYLDFQIRKDIEALEKELESL